MATIIKILLLVIGFLHFAAILVTAQGDDKETIAFKNAKGVLTCPVEDGKINKGKIFIDGESRQTMGVDIYGANENVVAVYDGVVVSAFEMGEKNYSVIISHGDYFSVYTGLMEASVESKSKLTSGTLIGKGVKQENGLYLMHFEIWKGSEKVFPIGWLNCKL